MPDRLLYNSSYLNLDMRKLKSQIIRLGVEFEFVVGSTNQHDLPGIRMQSVDASNIIQCCKFSATFSVYKNLLL
jgi:hypothetical protein